MQAGNTRKADSYTSFRALVVAQTLLGRDSSPVKNVNLLLNEPQIQDTFQNESEFDPQKREQNSIALQ
jgi:hypothetical protein